MFGGQMVYGPRLESEGSLVLFPVERYTVYYREFFARV